MKNFLSVNDAGNLDQLLAEADELRKNPLSQSESGKNRSLCLIFLNPSLRTRLSTLKAAFNLGLNTAVLDTGSQGWKLEFADGVVMDGDSAEHVKEAAAVIGSYYDIVAIRAFPGLIDRDLDYGEQFLSAFKKYCPAKLISMESSTRHPLQGFADLITIEQFKKTAKPKIVLTWAPHPKALPQSVANSFSHWIQAAAYELTITHPPGYELADSFTGNAIVEHDQAKAFEGADFVYAKNWCSYSQYGKILTRDPKWMVTTEKMKRTNNAKFMHCLPVRRNVVVEDAVLDSPQSIVVEQAVNRITSAQTVLNKMLKELN